MSKERGYPIGPELDLSWLKSYLARPISGRFATLEDAELQIQILFARIAACFGEEAACGLFKKYSKRTRSKHRRDTDLLLRFYLMEKPQKLRLAKQIDPKNPQRILAQLKRALGELVGQRSTGTEGMHDKWRSLFDWRFPGRR